MADIFTGRDWPDCFIASQPRGPCKYSWTWRTTCQSWFRARDLSRGLGATSLGKAFDTSLQYPHHGRLSSPKGVARGPTITWDLHVKITMCNRVRASLGSLATQVRGLALWRLAHNAVCLPVLTYSTLWLLHTHKQVETAQKQAIIVKYERSGHVSGNHKHRVQRVPNVGVGIHVENGSRIHEKITRGNAIERKKHTVYRSSCPCLGYTTIK